MPGSEFLKAESIIVLNRKLKSVGGKYTSLLYPVGDMEIIFFLSIN